MQRGLPLVAGFFLFAASSVAFAAEQAKVTSVIDGDTIKVRIGSTVESVRIIGVDAPELTGTAGKKCFGKEAGARMNALLRRKRIALERNPAEDRDVYGRLLRYVAAGKQDVGARLIEEGFARSYRWFSHPRLALYNRLEAEAKARKKGLWSACGRKKPEHGA